MSGHSKWSTIKRKKGAIDQKRGTLFTKLGRNISIAAKNGKDPEMNAALRAAMDAAREANMPKDNIQRAIIKGAGEIAGQQLEEITYEGYGPSGIAVIVQCITDNKNRTASFVKSVFTKAGGSLGGPNSVSYMFKQRGVIRLENGSEEKMLAAIDAGAEDVVEEDDGLTIYTSPKDFNNIKKILTPIDYAQVEMVPKIKADINENVQEKVEKLIEALEENDDVSNVYTNA